MSKQPCTQQHVDQIKISPKPTWTNHYRNLLLGHDQNTRPSRHSCTAPRTVYPYIVLGIFNNFIFVTYQNFRYYYAFCWVLRFHKLCKWWIKHIYHIEKIFYESEKIKCELYSEYSKFNFIWPFICHDGLSRFFKWLYSIKS